jgi:hypothetical protein
MESTATTDVSQHENIGARLRNAAIGTLFAAVLLIPRILHVRRDERSWLAFRVLMGLTGAGLVILPLAFWNSWLAGIAGLVLFLAAVLAPPAEPQDEVDDKARELGALLVVNGGKCCPGTGPASPVQLFVGSDTIWAMNSHLHALLTIPTAQILSVLAEETGSGWTLRLRWTDHSAEFSYSGIFAEHLARVAETSIRGVMPGMLPVLQPPRTRAARA